MSRKLSALLLCVFMIVAACISVYRLSHITIESSVLSLLPQSGEDSYSKAIEKEFIKRLNSQVIFAISKSESDSHNKALNKNSDETATDKSIYEITDRFADELRKSPYIENIKSKISDKEQFESAAFVYKYKTAFIDEKLKHEIASDNYTQKILAKLYSGFSGVSSAEIKNDLLMVGRNLATTLSANSSIRVENGHLVASDDKGTKWVLVFVTLNDDSLSTSVASDFAKTADNLINKIQKDNPSVSVLKKGAVFYSDYAASTSQREITLLGLITTIGIFTLIFFVYRSITPVVLTIGSVLCGIICALGITTLIYDEINLIIIGMCLSVIGIVCDYTIYFTTLRIGQKESSFETIRRLAKPLSFAVITDLCAYLIILLSPVRAVSQMALFCMCTITFACLFVIVIEPYFLKNLKKERLPFEGFFKGYLDFIRQKKISYSIIAVLCICSVFAFINLKYNDDPMSFQRMPDNLKSQELKINSLLKMSENLKYILINAEDDNTLLDRNEKLKEKLSLAVIEGKLKNYLAVKMNSENTQKDDCVFLNERKTIIQNELKKHGLNLEASDYHCEILKPQDFFSSSIGELYSSLYYKNNRTSSLMVVLEDVTDVEGIKNIAASIEGLRYLDHRGNLTEVFKMYREIFMKVIFIFMGCILLVSAFRVGLKKALVGTFFSLLSIGMALFVLQLCGYKLNLFSELGLIVLLGIGINYNIFMSSSKIDVTSIIAIFTALTTTLMTIGILIFSSVDAIKCFAICLVTGIICAFILSAMMPKTEKS